MVLIRLFKAFIFQGVFLLAVQRLLPVLHSWCFALICSQMCQFHLLLEY